MTTDALNHRRKPKAFLALAPVIILISALVIWLYPTAEKPPEIPPQAYEKVRENLLDFYQNQQVFAGFQHESEALDKKQFQSTRPSAKTNSVTFDVVSISERKTRRRIVVVVRPKFNGAPPPDGIAERSITLYRTTSGDWEIQPILPDGAPPLSQ